MTRAPDTPGLLTASLIGLSRYTPFGRGAARKLMAKAVRSLHPGPAIEASLYGGRARLHHTGNNSELKALLAPHRYAREEYAFCAAHMPRKGGVFVDIGANAGIFSLYMASRMASGTLIAAEPQPNMFARLEHNFALNPGHEKRLSLHLHQTAIGGAVAGTLTLSQPNSAGQASAHIVGDVPTIDVPILPLARLLDHAKIDAIDVLKIDVEGFEDQVLFPFFEAEEGDAQFKPEEFIGTGPYQL
ncbi:MAG: FkbM family methyltransferase, partial [Pseudomonadota bacterium]